MDNVYGLYNTSILNALHFLLIFDHVLLLTRFLILLAFFFAQVSLSIHCKIVKKHTRTHTFNKTLMFCISDTVINMYNKTVFVCFMTMFRLQLFIYCEKSKGLHGEASGDLSSV